LTAIRPARPAAFSGALITALPAFLRGFLHESQSLDSASSVYFGLSGQVAIGHTAQSPSHVAPGDGTTAGGCDCDRVHCPLSHGDAAGAVRRLPTPTVISMAENITTTNSFGFIIHPLPVRAVEAISIACFLLPICSYLLAVKVIRAK
jgi:hypothetical protein